jgi:DNA polymerase III gamma/tau subunit
LSRLVRDLMVVAIDADRLKDPEIAQESERERMSALAARFSREDLLRAFDLLTKAEYDIRSAAEPRYHLEMLMLRWMHARKLVPLSDIIERMSQGGDASLAPAEAAKTVAPAKTAAPPKTAAPARSPTAWEPRPGGAAQPTSAQSATADAGKPRSMAPGRPAEPPRAAPLPASEDDEDDTAAPGEAAVSSSSSVRDRVLDDIRHHKAVFYRMVVAQAQRITYEPGRLTFVFAPTHRLLGEQVEQSRAYLEGLVERFAGRQSKIAIEIGDGNSNPPAGSGSVRPAAGTPAAGGDTAGSAAEGAEVDLRARAERHEGLKILREVFPIEIRDVEEM